jgi:hypothetical protein
MTPSSIFIFQTSFSHFLDPQFGALQVQWWSAVEPRTSFACYCSTAINEERHCEKIVVSDSDSNSNSNSRDSYNIESTKSTDFSHQNGNLRLQKRQMPSPGVGRGTRRRQFELQRRKRKVGRRLHIGATQKNTKMGAKTGCKLDNGTHLHEIKRLCCTSPPALV